MALSASGQIGASEDLLVDRPHNMLHAQNLVQIVFGEDISDDMRAGRF